MRSFFWVNFLIRLDVIKFTHNNNTKQQEKIMETHGLKTWLNENYGITAADRERAAVDFGTTTPTLYRWMANPKFQVLTIENVATIIEHKSIKVNGSNK